MFDFFLGYVPSCLISSASTTSVYNVIVTSYVRIDQFSIFHFRTVRFGYSIRSRYTENSVSTSPNRRMISIDNGNRPCRTAGNVETTRRRVRNRKNNVLRIVGRCSVFVIRVRNALTSLRINAEDSSAYNSFYNT